ncbi:hypothetical protein [Moraxella lacunata]|uniref:hypothetical protein n=1 Tax=Moraxella lacunata TaxID=477 RepID=UPI003EE08915
MAKVDISNSSTVIPACSALAVISSMVVGGRSNIMDFLFLTIKMIFLFAVL